MDKQRIANIVTDILRGGRDVRCELGTIRLFERAAYEGRNPRTGASVPVPAKRYPIFAPSSALITAAFVGGNIPVPSERYVREARPDEVWLYDLTSSEGGSDVYANEAADQHIGSGVEDAVMGDELVKEVGEALRDHNKLGISGFGTFLTRRLPRRKLDHEEERRVVDADLVGKWIVAVKFSHVLLDALR